MTKRDVKSLGIGCAVSIGALFGIWFAFRRTRVLPEIQPVQVKWAE